MKSPFLAGFLGDTLVVYEAGTNDITLTFDGKIISRFQLDALDADATLRYAAVDGDQIAVKALDKDDGGHIAWYSIDGNREVERPLPGPYWRHAGLLKADGDSLLSLRGYLPLIEVYTGTNKIDSVALFGFDSPMLARTRLFEHASAKAPPLLSSSTATCGNQWYVLNIRPGWIRIDRFDRSGRLQSAYTQPDPAFDSKMSTTDIAVRCGKQILIAVAVANPIAEIRWYTLPQPLEAE